VSAPAAVRVAAHAKANLLLRVLARETDGYHGIETLFCLLDLADELTAELREPANGITLDVSGAATGPPEQNLAVRAARLVLDATSARLGVHLRLVKRIPVQAGLGGGSSDAAAALAAVNLLAGGAIPRHELLQFAARLGADVPFFFANAPLALAWGHGERMMRLPPLPAAAALLVVPPVPVPTADAYGWVDETRPDGTRRGAVALDAEVLGSWGDIARMAGNDFEAAVFGRHAAVRTAFEALAQTSPLLCRMTGSGSTLIAVYRSARDRDDAAMRLGRRHGATLPVQTMAGVPAAPEVVER
jgi:4-diphosphocytidyl-2-C-methyl-D-erythritol kinase